jgi:hypothetical protein
MGGAYPYMDLNAKYEKRYYDVLLRFIQIRYPQNEASAREIATCKPNVWLKDDFMHSNFQMDIKDRPFNLKGEGYDFGEGKK